MIWAAIMIIQKRIICWNMAARIQGASNPPWDIIQRTIVKSVQITGTTRPRSGFRCLEFQ